MDAKQQRVMLRQLRNAGYTVEKKDGKRKLRSRDGTLITVMPGDSRPSDRRAWDNCLSKIRTVTGFDFRPRSHGRLARA